MVCVDPDRQDVFMLHDMKRCGGGQRHLGDQMVDVRKLLLQPQTPNPGRLNMLPLPLGRIPSRLSQYGPVCADVAPARTVRYNPRPRIKADPTEWAISTGAAGLSSALCPLPRGGEKATAG